MKKILFFIGLIITISCYGQGNNRVKKYDKINIYAFPLTTSFAFDNIDPNFVRVNYEYKFSSREENYIRETSSFFFDNIDSLPSYSYFEDTKAGIRVVIDFISRENIVSTVLISSNYTFYLSEDYMSKIGWFGLNSDELCTIKEYVPFLDRLRYGKCYD